MKIDARHSSKQNQENINESQRDTFRKTHPKPNTQIQELNREMAKQGIKKGLIKQGRELL